MPSIFITLQEEEATKHLAYNIAANLQSNYFISLSGDLGSGKTCFARHLIQYLSRAEIEVPSPTFSLVQEYEIEHNFKIYHCDFYRLEKASDVLQLDLPIIKSQNSKMLYCNELVIVEWAEQAAQYLRQPDLRLNFEILSNDKARKVEITADEKFIINLAKL